jgi:peptide/nickel transport system substrate-binding protein
VGRTTFSRGLRAIALVLVLLLVAAACGSDEKKEGGPATPTTTGDVGKPVPGGEITYALEAGTSGGFCLAEAQLAIAGIQVARALYDTLTAPDANGEIQPYLAQSVTANAAATEFTIKLRSGIKFHDGSALTAQVVKNNIDAWRGSYKGRSPLLFVFVMQDVAGVEVVDPLTVKVTTKRPWPAFPWFLWASGRLGIMGQKQLDSERCNREVVGTGPFMTTINNLNADVVAVKNPNYWQKDEAGNQLPYLDRITFTAVESGPDRLTGLRAGDYDVIHTSGALQIVEIRKDAEAGKVNNVESDKFGELGYAMLNASKAPFDSQTARSAMAYGVDRDTYNKLRNEGILTNAQGPFAPGNVGYLEDAGYPGYDPQRARSLVAQYKTETGKDLEFTITHSGDPETTKTAELVQQMAQAVGAKVSLKAIGDQSTLINEAIGGNFQAILWRNHPGADPDTQYVWWYNEKTENADGTVGFSNPVNFGRFADPEINSLLDKGRTTLDQAERVKIYEDLNREFAKKLYNLWAQFTIWSVASKPNVHGVLGPNLPDGAGPFPGLATGHPLLGMWVKR